MPTQVRCEPRFRRRCRIVHTGTIRLLPREGKWESIKPVSNRIHFLLDTGFIKYLFIYLSLNLQQLVLRFFSLCFFIGDCCFVDEAYDEAYY